MDAQKEIMKKLILTVAFCLPMGAQAQSIEQVLQSIEKNNKELQSQVCLSGAEKMEKRAENNLPDPTVSYSSFYKNGAGAGHGTEFVATQGFDFPTQYITRNRQAELENRAIDFRREGARRDILLRAKQLCLDLILLNKEKNLMELRRKNADELAALYNQRFEAGDANVLDVNKIKMEHMNVVAEVAENRAAHRTALQSLLAMNGNLPLEFEASDYPQVRELTDYNRVYDEVMSADCNLQSADAYTRAAEKQVSVERQNWLPKLEAGFRRNTESEMSMNGFVVGGSIPLFSNRKKVQIAKAQAVGARLMQEDARLHAENSLMSLFNEMRQLKEALSVCDVPLMYRSLDLLKQALTEGQISLIDYLVEAENVYRNLLSYMRLENRYQKVVADICKNEL